MGKIGQARGFLFFRIVNKFFFRKRCVKYLLARYGFYQVWLNPRAISANVFINTFRQRLTDNYVQEWNNNVVCNNVLTLYKELKLSFEFEHYLDKLVSINLKIYYWPDSFKYIVK